MEMQVYNTEKGFWFLCVEQVPDLKYQWGIWSLQVNEHMQHHKYNSLFHPFYAST